MSEICKYHSNGTCLAAAVYEESGIGNLERTSSVFSGIPVTLCDYNYRPNLGLSITQETCYRRFPIVGEHIDIPKSEVIVVSKITEQPAVAELRKGSNLEVFIPEHVRTRYYAT